MRCKNCGREIDNMWGICPYCGFFSGELEDSFMNIARMFGGKAVIKQEGDSFIVILELQGVRQAFRITPIDVEEATQSLPQFSPQPPPLPVEPRKEREFDKTEEPQTEINQVQDRIYIKVNLSGVAEDEVDVDELENSVEVRAYKGKTRYFKLIPIPEEFYVVSSEVLPEEVIITLGRK